MRILLGLLAGAVGGLAIGLIQLKGRVLHGQHGQIDSHAKNSPSKP
jgi:hypothetical protein